MPRFPLRIKFTRCSGMCRLCASRSWVKPSGLMNSSRRISPGWMATGCFALYISRPLVVVRDFDVGGAFRRPGEADAELVVDADAVLPPAISAERLESVPRTG